MFSTMLNTPLTVNMLFRHGASIFPRSQVIDFDGASIHRSSFAEVALRVKKLAAALKRMGAKPGDRIGSFCWNSQQHLEAYLAVPMMGAVLHTLNVRLFPEQLAYIANHAGDRWIIVQESLLPVLAKAAPGFTTVEGYIVVGEGNVELPCPSVSYENILAAEAGDDVWPEPEEQLAAAICYTSGTTGQPKGVAYSHRSIFLHSMALCSANAVGLSEHDKVLMVASMFHATSWGLPYAAWMAGADIVLPGRHLQAEPLCRLIETEKATLTAGVPTVWNDVARHAEANGLDVSSLRRIMIGGSAVPRALVERMDKLGGHIVQVWGMTETSPIGTVSQPRKHEEPGREMDHRVTAGRPVAGIEMRIVHEGREQPWDGKSLGEIQVRGPWVTGSYIGGEGSDKFENGWLKTGDIGTIDDHGYLEITDRTKDVIKSGGEWVSSVELENAIMGHPGVAEAAVIGVPDPRWDERPLACVVRRDGSDVSAGELQAFIADKVARWWLPERWAFVDEIPKTSVGKFDKKTLRARESAGEIRIIDVRSR